MKKTKTFLKSIGAYVISHSTIRTVLVVSMFLAVPFLASAQPYSSSPSGSGWDPNALEDITNLPSGTVYGIIENALFWLLSIFGLIAVIGFVISGIMYLMAAGSEDTMKSAKRAMIYSIIGVLVALSGLVIIWAIDSFLSATPDF